MAMGAAEFCPYCLESIPIEEWPDHEAGIDAARLGCPHQDLEKIAEAQEGRWIPGVQLPDLW